MGFRISTDELIEELHRLDDEVEGSPTRRKMDQEGEYSHRPYVDRFGSWNEALSEAGLTRNTDRKRETLIEELQRLADEVGRTPSVQDMEEHGEFSPPAYTSRFGSWNGAKEAAGLDTRPPKPPSGEESKNYSKAKVECASCGEIFERQPAKVERTENNFCSHDCYADWLSGQTGTDNKNFEGAVVACDQCGEDVEVSAWELEEFERNFCSKDCYSLWQSENQIGEANYNWKGGVRIYYGGSWERQREKALERDGHQCQACGGGERLHVHHITPFAKFDDHEEANALKNLVVLCASCHRRWEGVPLRPELA